MRGVIDAARKVKHLAKGEHYRGGAIYRGFVDQNIGTEFGVGMYGILQRRG